MHTTPSDRRPLKRGEYASYRVALASGDHDYVGYLDEVGATSGLIIVAAEDSSTWRSGDEAVVRLLRAAGFSTLRVTGEGSHDLEGVLAAALDWARARVEPATLGCYAGGVAAQAALRVVATRPDALGALVLREGAAGLNDEAVQPPVPLAAIIEVDDSGDPAVELKSNEREAYARGVCDIFVEWLPRAALGDEGQGGERAREAGEVDPEHPLLEELVEDERAMFDRPSDAELGGMSEYQVEAATMLSAQGHTSAPWEQLESSWQRGTRPERLVVTTYELVQRYLHEAMLDRDLTPEEPVEPEHRALRWLDE